MQIESPGQVAHPLRSVSLDQGNAEADLLLVITGGQVVDQRIFTVASH